MKIFLVDVHKAIEMSHYETFFYHSIKQGDISIFDRSLDSLGNLDLVLTWITEEINRNPFLIDNALVVFFLPRNLNAERIPQDFEIYSQIYINELIERHLDKRFRYLCFYLDFTGVNGDNDAIYRSIDSVNDAFCSDNNMLSDSFLPQSLPEGNQKEITKDLIASLPDEVAASFYRRILTLVEQNELDSTKEMLSDEKWYTSMFLRSCQEEISRIKTFRCAYFSKDIEKKFESMFKVVKYICSFPENRDPEKDFDNQISDFLMQERYNNFDPDLNSIRTLIATYKERLRGWTPPDGNPDSKELKTFSHKNSDHSKEFEEEVMKISMTDLKNALNPSDSELSDFDLQDKVFASLDQLIQDVNIKLRAFCEKRVEEMRLFIEENPCMVERADSKLLLDDEKKNEHEAADDMNKYITSELPGYPAELKLRQELELLGQKIRKIGRYLKVMKPITFVFTLLFALVSVGAYYFGLQHSVFVKENTWDIFGAYIAVCAVLFAAAYVTLRVYYKRKVRKYLAQSLDKVMEFLKIIIVKAREFEANINSEINYYCVVDENNKKIHTRFSNTEYEKRKNWHIMKIKQILDNLSYFDAFVANTAPDTETNVPELKNFEDDAAHNDFYRMKIFK